MSPSSSVLCLSIQLGSLSWTDSGSLFEANQVSQIGGLLKACSSVIEMFGSQIRHNQAGESGGGCLLENSQILLDSIRAKGNIAFSNEGVLSLVGDTNSILSASTFDYNIALTGGAIYGMAFPSLFEVDFINNVASGSYD
jgi:hypothetical protein